MLQFMNNSNSQNSTAADLETVFKFSDLKSYPSYLVNYQSTGLPRFSNTICQEFDGDCMKYTQKYFELKFI